MTAVVGLDLSLTSTGIAFAAHGRVQETHRVRSTGKANAPVAVTARRLAQIEDDIMGFVSDWDIGLAVIEAPSFGSTNGGAHERGHLWWAIARRLTAHGIPVGTVAPMTLKVYATGNGRSEKADIIAAVRARYTAVEHVNNDEADAVVLAAMGARRIGEPLEADEVLTDKHLKAMVTAKWPQ